MGMSVKKQDSGVSGSGRISTSGKAKFYGKLIEEAGREMANLAISAVDELSEKRSRTSYAHEPSENPKDIAGSKKPPLGLIPPSAEVLVSMALWDGAKKYEPFNWRSKSIHAMRYVSAAKRHLAAWVDGEELAQDSKLPHLAHAVAGLMILLDALETGNCTDDRPKPGSASRVMERYTRK